MARSTPPCRLHASHLSTLYFPELRIYALTTDAEPIVDSLSTDFSAIQPVK